MTAGESTLPAYELLVVDDNPVTRYATARVLQVAGFGVREAGTAADALALADARIAGVVLDVHLPDMNGFEVCRLLRERTATARLPIIHLSAAYIHDDDKVRGLHSGADAYMTHPAEPALLVATLQALIRARTAEEGMRRSEARFRAIYEQTLSGIGLVDTNGHFVGVNPAMLTLLKRGLQEVVGRRLADFAPGDWAERIPELLETSAHGVWRGEFPLLDAAGAWVPVEWSLSAHVEPGVVLAIATDISERLVLSRQREELLEREQAARAAAERLNRSKDEFIAMLSHELRSPLNAIMGWVHVLKRLNGNDVMRRGLESIERNANAQTRLISDILDVSRLDLGKLRLDIEKLDVAALIETAVDALGASIEDRKLDVSVDLAAVTRPVHADPFRLQQIVWNLLTNAIKFSHAQGHIRVHGTQDEHLLTLTVEDDGKGINPDFLDILFDRFTQGDSGTNRHHGGLGLGLSIVKHLVELHGGTVEAYSAGLGQGAKFTVTLPAHAAADRPGADSGFASLNEAPGNEPDDEDALATLRILVIEDDKEAREMVALVLGDRGARVLTAHSFAEGLQCLQHTPGIDILISDIGMPGKDGYDLIRELRRLEAPLGRRLPAIALTAFTRPEDRKAALAAGFDEHCGKPLRPNQLVTAILRAVGRPAPVPPV